MDLNVRLYLLFLFSLCTFRLDLLKTRGVVNVWCSSSFGLQEGSSRTPETMQEARTEARDGIQKRTKGNLEEVRLPILRFDLLRLGRLFAAGRRPTHSLIAN